MAHAKGLAAAGGSAGVRSASGLASAVGRAQQTWDGAPLYPSLLMMAAVYLHGIAQNQPFVDGNKRAAVISALLFLDLNGIEHNLDASRWADAMERLARRELEVDGLAALLVAEYGRDVTIEPS